MGKTKTNLGHLGVVAASDAAALRDQERELDGEVVEDDCGEARRVNQTIPSFPPVYLKVEASGLALTPSR